MSQEVNITKQNLLHKFMSSKIQGAAKEIMAEKGFRGITMDQVAARAGISKATIYLYFENKDALLTRTLEDLLDGFTSTLKEKLKEESPPLKKIELVVSSGLDFFESELDFFKIYMAEKGGLMIATRDAHKARLREKYLHYVALVEDAIGCGMDQGLLRRADTRRAAFCLIEMMNAVILSWLAQDSKGGLRDEASFVLDLFLNGLQSEGGPGK